MAIVAVASAAGAQGPDPRESAAALGPVHTSAASTTSATTASDGEPTDPRAAGPQPAPESAAGPEPSSTRSAPRPAPGYDAASAEEQAPPWETGPWSLAADPWQSRSARRPSPASAGLPPGETLGRAPAPPRPVSPRPRRGSAGMQVLGYGAGITASLATAVVFGLIGYVVGPQGDADLHGGSVVGALLGVAIAPALWGSGIWAFGELSGGRSSLGLTILGSYLGLAAGGLLAAGLALAGGIPGEILSLPVAIAGPCVGGILAYRAAARPSEPALAIALAPADGGLRGVLTGRF